MSDEKIEAGGGNPATPVGIGRDTGGKPTDGDHNTDIDPPNAEGGQPAVGDDLPRSTEF